MVNHRSPKPELQVRFLPLLPDFSRHGQRIQRIRKNSRFLQRSQGGDGQGHLALAPGPDQRHMDRHHRDDDPDGVYRCAGFRIVQIRCDHPQMNPVTPCDKRIFSFRGYAAVRNGFGVIGSSRREV